jgi:hypothetical protein
MPQPPDTSTIKQGSNFLVFIINSGVFTITIVKYCLVPLLYRLIVKNHSQYRNINPKNDLKFIFINSAGSVDRLMSAIQANPDKHRYMMFYLFTSFPKNIYERLKKKPHSYFISPRPPGKKAIFGCLSFLFRNGQIFTSQLLGSFSHYPLSLRLKIATSITQYIYSMLIYHPWSVENAQQMAAFYPNALFIFDLDEAGKELMISDALNQIGVKTLLVQHGVLTDPKRYLPTCSFMACTSEREKQALISEGVDSKKLYVTGQALQTINDSIYNNQIKKITYPILILAGVGPFWLQRLYVEMLKYSQFLYRHQGTFMRIHPAMDPKGIKIWTYDKKLKKTDSGESLGECISKSRMVITFSIDALAVSVRQQHPTIVCIPESYFVPKWHDFLSSIPMVRVAKTPQMLDVFLADKDFRNSRKHDFAESQWRYVDYTFGELNTKENLTKLMHQLVTE